MPLETFQGIFPMLAIIVGVGDYSIDWCFQKYDSRAGNIAQVVSTRWEHSEFHRIA